MTISVNGIREGEVRTTTLRPRKADKGHSIVKMQTWLTPRLSERRAVVCECGKRYTGYGDRASYSHAAHVKKVLS